MTVELPLDTQDRVAQPPLKLAPVASQTLFKTGCLSSIAEAAARHAGAVIHPSVYHLESDAEYFRTKEGSRLYRRHGERALEVILTALLAAGHPGPTSILDMPCGFGRVARHLHAAFPDAKLTVCDIEPEALEWCAREYDATPALSQQDFAKVEFAAPVDLIWCGSLLTHLPRRQFIEALDLFARSLNPGGIAVVTTHGRCSAQQIAGFYLSPERLAIAERGYYTSGFGYVDYTEETTRFTGNYGISLSSLTFTAERILNNPALRLISASEASWGHQDVIVFQRDPQTATY